MAQHAKPSNAKKESKTPPEESQHAAPEGEMDRETAHMEDEGLAGIPAPEGQPGIREILAKLLMSKEQIPGTQGSNPAPMQSQEAAQLPQNPDDRNMLAMLIQKLLGDDMPPQQPQMPMVPPQEGQRE